MATIERAGKRWRVRQFTGGKLVTVASCATKPEAEAVLRRVEEEERARSSVVYASQIPMTEIIERWASSKIAEGNDPLHTAKAQSRLRGIVTARNWYTTASITPIEVSNYRQRGGSPRACAILAGVLRWAVDTLDQYIHPKALLALKPGRPGRKPSPVLMSAARVAEIEAIAERESDNAGALIHCLATYGWRPITAARLQVQHFNAETGTVHCQVKGGDEVRHPLLPETIERLSAVIGSRGPEEPIFIHPRTGKAWELDGARSISQWGRIHLRAKVYDLKRYAITSMLNRGIPAHDVASFTGHRTISQVLKYSRTNEARQAEVLTVIHGNSLEKGPNRTQPAAYRNLGFPSVN